jgi:hypothetical protein
MTENKMVRHDAPYFRWEIKMIWRIGIILGVVLVCGCLSPVRMATKVAGSEQMSRNSSEVEIFGGRDVMNVSPTLAMSGGGGIMAGVILIGTTLGWMRSRRTLRAMISAIEQVEDGQEVKQQISRAALAAGVADYLHGRVKKVRKK